MNQHLDRLDGLAPMLHAPMLALIERCEAKLQRKLLVVSCWRSVQEQLLNYRKGRTLNRETGIWVVTDRALVITNAQPGFSAHNVITRAGQAASMAADLIPLHPDGTADWTPGEDFWDGLFELAWKVGLDPLGDPLGSYLPGDFGHFEEPAWKLKLDGLFLMLPGATLATVT